MSGHSEHSSFTRYCIQGVLIVLLAAVATHFLEKTSLFRRLENTNLDTWLLARKPTVSDEVMVVVITEDDYKNLFRATSPLNQDLVQEIVRDIVDSGASVLGVDLDTSRWDPAKAAALKDKRIVWAREASEEQTELYPVLGGNGEGVCYGLPAYVPDDDFVIRRYDPVLRDKSGHAFPSIAEKLARGCEEAHPAEPEAAEEEAKLINFLGGRMSFDHLSAAAVRTLSKVDTWKQSNPLKGKIVILGGSYRAARDRFLTPAGPMDGVDILAHAVQSELADRKLREPGQAFFFILDVALGVILVLGTWFLPRAFAVPVVLTAIPVIAFLVSLVAFQTLGYFASFVPVLGGVLLHHLIEHVQEYRHLEHERDHLIRERDALLRERENIGK